MSYELGCAEALAAFGVKEASVPAGAGALIGAGLGYLADPEHSWQAALMGGAAGGAMGYGVSKHLTPSRPATFGPTPAPAAPAGHHVPPAPPAAPAAPAAPHTSPPTPPAAPGPSRFDRVKGYMKDLFAAPPAPPNEAQRAAHLDRQFAQAQQLIQRETAANNAALAQHAHAPAPTPLARAVGEAAGQEARYAKTRAMLAREMAATNAELANLHKTSADFGMGVSPSGPTLSAFGSPEERLPGMHRWVPREAIEDVYRQLDMGVDPQNVHSTASPLRGALGGAGLGATAGLILGKPDSMRKGLVSAGLGAGLGALGGLGAHFLSSGRRESDVQEALHGVLPEAIRNARPASLPPSATKPSMDSAREAIPLTVSTSAGL